MISRETALGAVCVYWDEVHEPDEREIRLLSALARQAAIALDNARLVGDLRRTLDDLRAAQETLVRGATLRAVGELAAGAAHHLNNLMAVVLGRTQLLLMKKPDAPTATSLRSIERAATDAAETVVRIQGFSRTAKRGETASFDLNAAVQEAIEFTRSRWQDEAQVNGAPIDVAFERGSPPPISGRSAEIREVMTNLILNAVDALPAGGRIAVRTREEPGRAVVSVSDTGIGMSSRREAAGLRAVLHHQGCEADGARARRGVRVDPASRRPGRRRERGGARDHGDLLASRRRVGPGRRSVTRGGSAASSSSTTRPTCASSSPTC